MTVPPARDENEYIELGQQACDQIKQVVESDRDSTWANLEWDEPDLKVYSRKSVEYEDAQENMLMLVTTLQASTPRLERLMFPWFEYRTKWDEMLERCDVIQRFNQEAFLVRHVVRKRLTLTARDSIDVIKVHRESNGVVVMGSASVQHSSWPPQDGFVRTRQFLGGYYLKPITSELTQLNMIFCADLNLPIPRFLSALVAKLKPRLMVEKTKNLKKAVNNLSVD